MKRVILYLLLTAIVWSCAQESNEMPIPTQKEVSIDRSSKNPTADLELIITQKLQEIYDLQNIYTDSTVGIEIRNQAKKSLNNLLQPTDSLVYTYTSNPKISNVKINPENNHVTFLVGKIPTEADVEVAKRTVKLNGKIIDNITITVKEISLSLKD